MKKFFANFEEIATSIFLVLIIGLTSFNVLLRMTTSHSIQWTEEFSYFCFAWLIFVGMAAAYKRSMHAGIDLLIRFFPNKIQKTVSIATVFLILIGVAVLGYLSLNFAIHAWGKVTPVLKISYFFIDISITVGCILVCLHSIAIIRHMVLKHDYFGEIPLYENLKQLDNEVDIHLAENN